SDPGEPDRFRHGALAAALRRRIGRPGIPAHQSPQDVVRRVLRRSVLHAERVPRHNLTPGGETDHRLRRHQLSEQCQPRDSGSHIRLDSDDVAEPSVWGGCTDYTNVLSNSLPVVRGPRCAEERTPDDGLPESALRVAVRRSLFTKSAGTPVLFLLCSIVAGNRGARSTTPYLGVLPALA